MIVTARFYGHLQLKVGRRQLSLDLPAGATLRQLVAEMDRRLGERVGGSFQPFEDGRFTMLILVDGKDQQFLGGLDTALQEGANIDFLPPMAGG